MKTSVESSPCPLSENRSAPRAAPALLAAGDSARDAWGGQAPVQEKACSQRASSLRGTLGSCFGGERVGQERGAHSESAVMCSRRETHLPLRARHQVDHILTAHAIEASIIMPVL